MYTCVPLWPLYILCNYFGHYPVTYVHPLPADRLSSTKTTGSQAKLCRSQPLRFQRYSSLSKFQRYRNHPNIFRSDLEIVTPHLSGFTTAPGVRFSMYIMRANWSLLEVLYGMNMVSVVWAAWGTLGGGLGLPGASWASLRSSCGVVGEGSVRVRLGRGWCGWCGWGGWGLVRVKISFWRCYKRSQYY